MNSLRTRLFLQVSLVILFFAGAVLVLNTVCLEPYYVWQEKRVLLEQARAIDALAITDYTAAALQLEEIEKTHGLWLLVLGADASRKYSTSLLPGGEIQPPRPPLGGGPTIPHQLPFSIVESEELPGGGSYQVQQDNRMSVSYLVYRQTLQSGDVLELRVLKNSLRQSVAIANRFLLWIGGVALLVTLGWAFWFSRRFTSPIVEMNGVTRAMAGLDFRRKCLARGADELAELAKSINHLSERLSDALADLQSRNARLETDIAHERNLEQMRRRFVQSVSHELKTPICIIRGYAEGLKLNVVRDADKRTQYAQVIGDEALKMDRLVADLLQLSQYQSGQMQLSKSKVSMAELAERTVSRLQPLFSSRGISVECTVPADLIAWADELRIEQVLTNYLNNAGAHADQDKLVTVTGLKQGDHCRITVFNTGEAIPIEDLTQIWVSFYRGDKARSRDQGRYGLGLAIVQAIMELHGQKYGVRNVPGGVEFWFELECADEITPCCPDSRTAADPSAG